MSDYEIVIGLEIHAELSTKSKIFCSCTTQFGGEVNTHCCPVCTGMPGTLPILNEKVVLYAAKAGLAMNCEIAQYSKQDRKNYFYPDLPKAYQISQYDLPLCSGGYIDIKLGEDTKRIGITRIHIEEDAGKLLHDEWEAGSLIDYNRCGVPLIEIVSEPDMRSAEEARLFVEGVKSILEYTGVSDCKMQEGSLRADVNLSVRKKGQREFGTRTEMKNLNSFRSIVRAINAEAERQIEEIEAGGKIVQETRRWDDNKGISYAMRSKEEAHDYRYFPDPDLVPVVLTSEEIQNIKDTLPELPEKRKQRYVDQLGLPAYDAELITASKYLADFFEEVLKFTKNIKGVSNFILGDLLKSLKDNDIEAQDIPFPPKYLGELVSMVDDGKISNTIARKVFSTMFDTKKDPMTIVKEQGLEVVNDERVLLDAVKKVISSNPQSVADFKNGKDKAFGFLIGQAMKETRGKANPQLMNRLLKETLEKQ